MDIYMKTLFQNALLNLIFKWILWIIIVSFADAESIYLVKDINPAGDSNQ
jgi:hypothetical protein